MILRFDEIFRRYIEVEMEVQETLKEILEGAIQLGNTQEGITVQEFVNELKEQMKYLLEKTNV